MKQRQENQEETLLRVDETIRELKLIQQNQHELLVAIQLKLCPAPGTCMEVKRDFTFISRVSDEREARLRATEQLTAVLGESMRSLNVAMESLSKSSREHGETLAGIRAQSGVIAVVISIVAAVVSRFWK